MGNKKEKKPLNRAKFRLLRFRPLQLYLTPGSLPQVWMRQSKEQLPSQTLSSFRQEAWDGGRRITVSLQAGAA